MKKWISLVLITSLFTASLNEADAREYCTDTGGCAYEEAYQSCCIAPAIALALAAIAAIIAVGVHNRSKSSHAHNSSDTL